MSTIELREVSTKSNNSQTIIHPFDPDRRTASFFKRERLTVSYSTDVSNVDEGVLSIPLVANLAPIAWFTGTVLHVPQLDERFFEALQAVRDGYIETFQQAGVEPDPDGEIVVDMLTNTAMKKNTRERLSTSAIILWWRRLNIYAA